MRGGCPLALAPEWSSLFNPGIARKPLVKRIGLYIQFGLEFRSRSSMRRIRRFATTSTPKSLHARSVRRWSIDCEMQPDPLFCKHLTSADARVHAFDTMRAGSSPSWMTDASMP